MRLVRTSLRRQPALIDLYRGQVPCLHTLPGRPSDKAFLSAARRGAYAKGSSSAAGRAPLGRLWRLLLLFVVGLGACTEKPAESPPTARKVAVPGKAEQKGPQNGPVEPRLEAVVRRAVAWAGGLDVDPMRVRDELGMKGVKHFVEYLSLLHQAHRMDETSAFGKEVQTRAVEVLRVVELDGYHVLSNVDDRRFRQDSMSYLRAALLAKRFGVSSARYRRELEAVLGRLKRALPTRGVDQRMGFAFLLAELGFDAPETRESIYPESLIARQVPLAYYLVSPDRPYDITHEIFAMTGRGTRPFPFPRPQDQDYARRTVEALLSRSLKTANLDLAAEFLVNLAYLGQASSPLAEQAREFIFRGQNPDGSFARYDAARARQAKGNPRYDVRIGGNLHTTMVCIWALIETAPDA